MSSVKRSASSRRMNLRPSRRAALRQEAIVHDRVHDHPREHSPVEAASERSGGARQGCLKTPSRTVPNEARSRRLPSRSSARLEDRVGVECGDVGVHAAECHRSLRKREANSRRWTLASKGGYPHGAGKTRVDARARSARAYSGMSSSTRSDGE
jgi:hypothetical protein